MEADALPSIQAVLDRLKSDGTFDQFRKKCLAAIEEEVHNSLDHEKIGTSLLNVAFLSSPKGTRGSSLTSFLT